MSVSIDSSHLSQAKMSRGDPGHLRSLDGFRGVAALLVLIWHHYIMMLDTTSPRLFCIYSLGFVSRSGVDMFFVLSGFLIARTLFKHRDSTSFFVPFYIRRFFRIAPLYLALLLIYTVIKGFAPQADIVRGSIPSWCYWLLLQNYYMPFIMSYGAPILGATWSVAVEEQFYLVFPTFVRFVRMNKLPWLFLGVSAVSVVSRYIASRQGNIGWFSAYTWSLCRSDALMLGAMIAWTAEFRPSVLRNVAKYLGRYAMVFLIFVPLSGPFIVTNIDFYMARWGYLLFEVVYGLLLIAALEPTLAVNRILSHPVLGYFGRISYGLYLYQGPVIMLCRHWSTGDHRLSRFEDLIAPTVALLCTVALSHFSYWFFESRFIRVGRRLGSYGVSLSNLNASAH